MFKPSKSLYNITNYVFISQSLVQSLVNDDYFTPYHENKDLPVGIFGRNFILDMKKYIPKG